MPARRSRFRRAPLSIEWLEPRALLTGAPLPPIDGGTTLQVTSFNPSSGNAQQLIAALLGSNSGITVLPGSVVYRGIDGQAGFHDGLNADDGTTQLKLDKGILLTSGNAALAEGNNTSGATAFTDTGGDDDLAALISEGLPTPVPVNDVNILQFQFTVGPEIKSLTLKFVFGSEEFPEFVGSYNDVLGIYVDGRQIAFDADGKPLTVNNNFFRLNNSGDTTDPDTAEKTVVNYIGIQYDGLTPVLLATASLDVSAAARNDGPVVHTLKIAIADAGDRALDSGVFLASLSSSTSSGQDGVIVDPPPVEPPPNPPPEPPPPEPPPQIVQPVLSGEQLDELQPLVPPPLEVPLTVGVVTVIDTAAPPTETILPTVSPTPGTPQPLFGSGGDVETIDAELAGISPDYSRRVDSYRATPANFLAEFVGSRGLAVSELESLLINLADVEEPRLLAMELGDEVVTGTRRVEQTVATKPITEGVAVAMPVTASAVLPPEAEGWLAQWWWVAAVPVGLATAATGWLTWRKKVRAGKSGIDV